MGAMAASRATVRRIAFQGQDGVKLAGIFQRPKEAARGAVVLSHCFTCNKDYKILVWLARELTARGHPVLRFDFAGLGESGGEPGAATLSTDTEDLLAAVAWLEREGMPTSGLVGHSMGGAASILAAARLPHLKAVAVLGATARVGSRMELLLGEAELDELERNGSVTVAIGNRTYPITRSFLEDLERHSVVDTVSAWDKALLVIHGTDDRVVPMAEAERLFDAARHPKAFLSVPGGDHLLAGDRRQAPKIGQVVAAWIELNGGDAS
jgi:uncharacterized protein